MQMRLIDADALTEFIDDGHLNNPNEKLYSENDIREMIDMMPTVDAVPVIRCKDCVEFNRWDDECGECYDGLADGAMVRADGYCYAAERRNDGIQK